MGHLWPKRASGSQIRALGLQPEDMLSAVNGILLASGIERAFDHLQVCYMCHAAAQQLSFRVMDKKLAKKDYVLYGSKAEKSSEDRCFGQLEGKPINFPQGKFPFRRILWLHAYHWKPLNALSIKVHCDKNYRELSITSSFCNLKEEEEDHRSFDTNEKDCDFTEYDDKQSDSNNNPVISASSSNKLEKTQAQLQQHSVQTKRSHRSHRSHRSCRSSSRKPERQVHSKPQQQAQLQPQQHQLPADSKPQAQLPAPKPQPQQQQQQFPASKPQNKISTANRPALRPIQNAQTAEAITIADRVLQSSLHFLQYITGHMEEYCRKKREMGRIVSI